MSIQKLVQSYLYEQDEEFNEEEAQAETEEIEIEESSSGAPETKYLYENEDLEYEDFSVGDFVENEWGDEGTRYGEVVGVSPAPGVDQWVTVRFMDGSRDVKQGDSLVKISQDEYESAVENNQIENPEPQDDDIFFTDKGVSAGGKFLGKFTEGDDAEKAVVAWINKNKWSPDMWYVSDHGNVSPYQLSPENAALIKM